MDAVTLERARRGERDAQAVLLRSMQDTWFRFCRAQARGDDEFARDATQETALRVLRTLRAFRGDSRVETWSLGIALNVCREMQRRRRRDFPAGAANAHRSDADAHPATDRSAFAAAASVDDAERLRRAIEELSERQRQAVTLRFLEGMSIEQTADAMGCATGTVKATVFQALRLLRRRLDPPADGVTPARE